MCDTSKRAFNFTKKEEELLMKLIFKNKKVIDCKRTDFASSSAKNAAWCSLTNEFNANVDTRRATITLRRKYENMKKRSRKRFAEEKMSVSKTEEEPPITIKIDPIYDDDDDRKFVVGVVENVCITEYDSTGPGEQQESNTDHNLPSTKENDSTWREYSPSLLPPPVNSKLRGNSENGKKKNADESWPEVAKRKLCLIELQKSILQEEHNFKMMVMKEEHELNIKKAELEIEILKLKKQLLKQ